MLKIIGIGASGLDSLSDAARAALDGCTVVFGGQRHLSLIPQSVSGGIKKIPWPKPWRLPLEEIRAEIAAETRAKTGAQNGAGQGAATSSVGVLVSGDPSWYSAATALYERFDCQVFPAPGAFSLAAARMGWALEGVRTGTLHGRIHNGAAGGAAGGAVDEAVQAMCVGGRHLLLSDRKSLAALIDALHALAFSPVQNLILLENLGSGAETRRVLDLEAPDVPDHDLFTIAAEVEPQPRLVLDADFLPDDAFETHGKITKFEARSSAVAQLRTAKVLWDVGAGAGTVGLQAAYTLQADLLILIESDAEALKVLERNCANASAPAHIVAGTAPDALADLPQPDAIFIGGGLSDASVLAACWAALAVGGRLVAHAVTLESEAVLLAFFASHARARLTRQQHSLADAVGGLHGWRPAMPLTQLVIEKD